MASVEAGKALKLSTMWTMPFCREIRLTVSATNSKVILETLPMAVTMDRLTLELPRELIPDKRGKHECR